MVQDAPMTFLAFDFGTKRIGMAVGQTLTQSACPIQAVKNQQNIPDWPAILSAIETWQPHALVVGIPVNMDGTEQPLAGRAKHFAKELQAKTQLTIHEADERLTTVEAKQQLFESGGKKAIDQADIDSVAAQLLLQQFLCHHSHKDMP